MLQIFGRAGRPQFEDRGVGYIITTAAKVPHYLSAMTQQHPIESKLIERLIDNLNAEIALGTVNNIDEAVTWLSYTYSFVRMKKNPLHYGLDWKDVVEDKTLYQKRKDILTGVAKTLHKTQMIVFDERTGYLTPKDLGRISSAFYITQKSIEIYNEMMRPQMTHADVLSMVSLSHEFENIRSRDEEGRELKLLAKSCICAVRVSLGLLYCSNTPRSALNVAFRAVLTRRTAK